MNEDSGLELNTGQNRQSVKSFNQTIIAIGASAGGLEALQDFLSGLPSDLDKASIVIAQHLSPTHKSMLVKLLTKGIFFKVKEAEPNDYLENNTIYITPPDKEITVLNGKISLSKPKNSIGPKPSIDILFKSVAESSYNNKIAIILSGTGTDGALGIKEIKKAGGITIVQDPETAKYDGMPLASIDTKCIDYVLSPREMGGIIKKHLQNPYLKEKSEDEINGNSISIEKIFKLLSQRKGTDFTGYKPSTLYRRLEKRLGILNLNSIEEYLTLIQTDPKELDILFELCLIGVTNFFRDKAAFEAFEKQLEKLLANKAPTDRIRIWGPGCSTGEEAYSVAILVSKLLKDRLDERAIQIFATDIDEKSIAFARKGMYPVSAVEDIPKDILAKYFIKKDNEYGLTKEIRSLVLFTKHDLTNNPPFLNLDLIICRNLLIYFDNRLQQQIFPVFHYSLNPQGLLFLGKAESIGHFSDLFSTIDGKNKLYLRKRGGATNPFRYKPYNAKKAILQQEKSSMSISDMVKETVFNTFEYPYVVIDENLDIVEVVGDVRLYLSLQEGLMNFNIINLINKDLQIELRSSINGSIKERQVFKSRIKKFDFFGQTHLVRFNIKPLIYAEAANSLFLIIFEKLEPFEAYELSQHSYFSTETENPRIEDLEKELNATKEQLQTYIEELDTSNEELQSLNEELQSTNEELQSSTEELETSNEELQSSNEEIHIAYAELKTLYEELEKKEALLLEKDTNQKALLNNTLQAFLLVDPTYKIIAYNQKAEDIVKTLSSYTLTTGDSLIDTLEPSYLETFLKDFKRSLEGHAITGERLIMDYQGKPHWFAFNYTPVKGPDNKVNIISVALLDITEAKLARTNLQKTENLLASVFNATNVGICITDKEGTIKNANEECFKTYGYRREELIDRNFSILMPPDDRKEILKIFNEFIKGVGSMPEMGKVMKKDGTLIDVTFNSELLIQEDGTAYMISSIKDVTETKKYKDLLVETQQIALVGGWEYEAHSGEILLTEELLLLLDYRGKKRLNYSTMSALFPPKEEIIFKEAFENGLKYGQSFDIELGFIKKGKYKWLRATGKPILSGNRIVKLYGTFQDITSRKTFELQLIQSENKYRSIVENSLNAFFLTIPDGTILDANQAAFDMFGYSPEELKKIGRKGIIDEHSPQFANLVTTREKIGKVSGEFTGIRKNGERFPCEFSSVIFFDINGEKRTSTIVNDISDRKKAELEMQKALEDKQKILNASLDVICSFDEEGRFIQVNHACKTVWGFEPEELLGTRYMDLVFEEDRAKTEQVSSSIIAGIETRNFENRYIKKDGTTVPIVWSARWDSHEKTMFCIARDASEKKAAEEKLRQNEARLLHAQKIAKLANWDYDIKNDKLYWSPETYQILGLNSEEYSNPTLEDFISRVHPNDRQIVLNAKEAAEKSDIPLNYEHRIVLPDGSIKYVYERGHFTRNIIGEGDWLSGTIQDITERKEAELENERLLNVLKRTLNEVYIFNSETFKFEYVNESAIANLGFTFQEMTEKTPVDLSPAYSTGEFKKLVSPLFSKEKEKLIFETVYKRANGTYYPVDVHLQLVINDENPVFLAIVIDISERKKAQKELATFFKFSPDMLCIAGMDGYFKRINPAFSKILGYSTNELLEKRIVHFIHQDDLKNTSQELTKLSHGGNNAYYENRYITKKRTIKWLAWTSTSIPGENLIFSVAKDITYRKQLEEELLQSSQRINNILESITDGFFTVNKDWIVTYWNKEAEKMLQMPREIIIGKNLWEVYEEAKPLKFYQEYNRALEEKVAVHFEEFYPPANTWFEVSVYPSEEGLTAYFKDVTERRNNQNEIRIAKERYDAVAKATNDAIWDFDFETQEFHWGEGLKNIFGHNPETTFSSSFENWMQHVHSDDVEKIKEGLMKALSSAGEQQWQEEYRFKKADDSYANVLAKGHIIRNESGKPVRMIGALQDITNRIKIELELKELNSQILKRAEELSASNSELEQFAYIASHDLQEPLRMVTSFLKQLEKKYKDQLDDKARQYIHFATDGAARMRSIILDLLEYSRVGKREYEVEQVDMNELVYESVQLNSKLIEENDAIIEWDGLPVIKAAKTPMLQLLQNLISNAIKYQKPEGKPKVIIASKQTDLEWVFSVSDNGIGIDPRFKEKIFILFQRLHNKDEYSGTGIGLAICKKIIEAHKGKIWVESLPGEGSTFYFTIQKN